MWRVPRDWEQDDDCFIVCGGESVRDLDLSRLHGRRVIVVNSSYGTVPHADYLVFADKRWWTKNGASVLTTFRGKIVTITPMRPSLSNDYLLLERQKSGGLSPKPTRLALWHTVVTAATNLAVHLGVRRRINYLGLDGKGGWHHEPHPWKQVKNKFDYHRLALEALVEPLRACGIEGFNSYKDSAHKMFAYKPFEEMLTP